MGLVHDDFILKNAADVSDAIRGRIKDNAVRQVSVKALVDTGSGTLVISEDLRLKLGLEILGLRSASFGNDKKEICKVTEPVEVHWHDRSMACRALVTSDAGETLIGAIPLEDMDLIVDAGRQQLVGAHGDEIICTVK